MMNNGNGGEKVIAFNGFYFPKFPSMNFSFEGLDGEHPSQLFIEDKNQRFLVSFDIDMKDMELLIADKTDYDRFEFYYHNKRFSLSYPCQKDGSHLFMGYFRIDIKDLKGDIHSCVGQLSITPPKKYIEGVKEFRDLQELIKGVEWHDNYLMLIDSDS